MKIPTKKLKGSFEMPVFGIGTWQMGGRSARNLDNDDRADVFAIKEAIELGVVHIDTAEIYANGHAEKLVGEAIANYDREKLFIASKVDPSHFAKSLVIKSCEASLSRLRTDYLDLYLLHAPPEGNTPLAETMEAMGKLVSRGLVKNIGVSNFAAGSMVMAQNASEYKIVTNQVHYNLRVREAEESGLLAYCQQNDLILTAYRPLEKGMLNRKGLLADIAKKYGKTPLQVAINWLISQDNVVTIAKSTNILHLKENLGAVGWNLDQGDVEELRSEFPGQLNVSDVIALG